MQYIEPPTAGLTRRQSVLAAGSALICISSKGVDAATSRIALAEQWAVWGIPLVRTGRYLARAKAAGLQKNRFYVNQTLATPSLKLAGPNVDTIYGFAWIDVSAGPVAVVVPDGGDRYYSVQFIDAYETILGYAGKSATSRGPGLYVITGPGWSGALPPVAKSIASPTNLVLALTRTLVKSAGDLPAAQALQAGYALAPLSSYPADLQRATVLQDALSVFPKLDLHHDASGFFADLDGLVREYPPRGQEAEVFHKLHSLHIGEGFKAHNRLSGAQLQQALDGALAQAQARSKQLGSDNDGWKVNYRIRSFNADPLTRAALNSAGPGAHSAEEALYFIATSDAAGAALDGTRRYRIVFPKGGLPPTKSFWSLILYDAKSLFLVANKLDRYTINDRTPDLVHSTDGALPIEISNQAPTDVHVNWLPAPAGPFMLVLRTYEPDTSLLSGTYKVPPVVLLG